jgi:oligopeptide transport system substrate-binding protein
MGRLLLIPIALLVMLLGAMAWSGGGVERRAEFAFINRGDIYTLDLNQMSYMQDFRLTYGIREGLYSPDPVTLRPVPAGAVGYDLSEDKRVWTFHLRKEAKWSNGDPVTAGDYVFSWRRMLEEPGEYTYLFFYVRGAEEYSRQLQVYYSFADQLAKYDKDPLAYAKEQGAYDEAVAEFEKANPKPKGGADPAWDAKRKALDAELVRKLKPRNERPDFAKVGIEAVNDLTFRVSLRNPVTYLLELAAFPPFYPRHARSMERFKFVQNEATGQYTYENVYTRPPHVVTNGPFNLTRWDFKRRLILEKSPTYWDRANVRSESIEMVVSDNPLSQFLMYESGKVDWMSEVDGDLAAELKEKKRADLKSSPAFGTAFLTFICTPKLPDNVAKQVGSDQNPLADVRVRQALAMAIDKRFIVENVTRMDELPARSYVPPDGTLEGYTWPAGSDKSRMDYKAFQALLRSENGLTGPGPGLRYDTARAKQLLAEAGYPEGKGFPKLPIIYGTNSPVRQKITQVLKNQWKEALNVDVDIQGLEGKNFRDKVSNKEYAIAPVAWYGDYPDASTFTDKYLSNSKQNDSAYINPRYDELVAMAAKEGDAAKRLAMLSEAENFLNVEAPIVPLYHYVNTSLNKPNVFGCDPNPRMVTIFKAVRVDRGKGPAGGPGGSGGKD